MKRKETFRKGMLIVITVVTVMLIVGCAPIEKPSTRPAPIQTAPPPPPTPTTTNDSTVETIDMKSFPVVNLLTAELIVETTKSLGRASGKAVNKTMLEKNAVVDALKKANRGSLDENMADVLIEPTYFYEITGADMSVTVIGYPARYRNFKNLDISEDWKELTPSVIPTTNTPRPQPQPQAQPTPTPTQTPAPQLPFRSPLR
jgi:hypothetical protein